MLGTFEKVLSYLRRRNHTAWAIEASTGNYYRVGSLLSSLQKQPNEPGYNPGLRFAEVDYEDRVYQGTQGFVSWVVPNANPSQRKLLYIITTAPNWVSIGDYWRPDRVNGFRQ
jgi:hypothetical protein